MSTSLRNAEILLSKQLGDYWDSASTSAGEAGGTTIVDTALKAKANDWITDEAYDQITEAAHACLDEERKISSLVNTSGTLTILAHSAQIGSGVDYRVHRLFTASEKRRALVHAAKATFPSVFAEIRDENLTAGNWLRDPSVEWNWTSGSANTYWKASAVTLAKATSYPYYIRGSIGMGISGAVGYAYQSNTENPDLLKLAGKTVTFKCKAWCDTASALRLGICYDGTNIEYGDYHPGGSKWADEDGYNHLDSFLWVQKQIDDDPTAVSFRIYLASAAATAYVDDLRVIGPQLDRYYIGDLNLALEKPHQVLQSSDTKIYQEPWAALHGWTIGSDDYLYLPHATQDNRLRILGINYLDFYDTSGIVGTDWDDTIALDAPQTEILVAQAAVYLCMQNILPADTPGATLRWKEALIYWQTELAIRKGKFSMRTPPTTIHWSV